MRNEVEIQIRKSEESDIKAVGKFYDEVILWLDAHINYPKWQYKIYPCEKYARDMTNAGFQYVCIEGDEIIAAFVLNNDPEGAYEKGFWSRTLPDGSFMVIHALAISDKYRGCGLGSKIVEFCISEAKKQGYKGMRLDIVPGNEPAKRLYENIGFTYVGDADLDRGTEHIPEFSLYELYW